MEGLKLEINQVGLMDAIGRTVGKPDGGIETLPTGRS